MTNCELCYPGECTPASHEAAEAAEYEADTCKVCGATPGTACDFEEHRAARERRAFVDHLQDCDGCSAGFPCEYARAQAAS